MTAPGAAASSPDAAAPKKILVVDDDPDIREAITYILELDGYEVATAGDGLDALAYLRANPAPSLILLDWMMPHCDASQFRAEQLRDPELAKIPVVLLTADVRVVQKLATLALAGGLSKPVDLQVLLDTVKQYCS